MSGVNNIVCKRTGVAIAVKLGGGKCVCDGACRLESDPRPTPPPFSRFSFVSGPTRDRKSSMLSKAVLWNKAGVRLGSTSVTDEIDFIQYGGGIFRRGEWIVGEEFPGGFYIFEQCEAPVTFVTDKVDP